MPVTFEKVVGLIESVAPKQLAYDWDNSGVQLQCAEQVSKILIALDVTQAVVDEAVQLGCDMILSHHPLIFTPIKSLSIAQPTDSVVMRLIRHGISVYSAHTSFDRASGGINDILADKLGLSDVQTVEGDGEGLMRIGALRKTMDAKTLAAHVKQSLGINTLLISDANCDNIRQVAVVGGSGGGYSVAAQRSGAQALITGEAKHSHYMEAAARGVLLIEAGHFATEQCFADGVFLSLQSRQNEVQLALGLKLATREKAPYQAI